MKYFADFKSLENQTNKTYRVIFITDSDESVSEELSLSFENPVVISTNSDSLFAPIKSRGCTVSVNTDELLSNIYTPQNQGVPMSVQCLTDNEILFEGYLTPNVYTQPYANVISNIELECVDRLSTLKNIKYSKISTSTSIQTFQSILYHIFSQANYTGNLYYQYDSLQGNSIASYSISENNFFDDDEEATPWNCYEILEEICKFFGWSAVPHGNNVYLVDYQTIAEQNGFNTWVKITSATSSEQVTLDNTSYQIIKDDYAGNDQTISHDDVYNKIVISDSVYEIDDDIVQGSDIFDNEQNHLLNIAANMIGSQKFVHTVKKDSTTWQIYYSIFQLTDESKWTQHFYDMNTYQEVDEPMPILRTAEDWSAIEGEYLFYPNKVGLFPQKYWIFENGANLTAKLDTNNVLIFNELTWKKADAIGGSQEDIVNYYNSISYLPVMEYEYDQELAWKSLNGHNFLLIKGDLLYQCDHGATEVWQSSQHFFSVFPYCDIETVEDEYAILSRSYSDEDYNKGWQCMQCMLQIGDKYWNGTNWTTLQNATFWLYYHKGMMNADSEDDETFVFLGWNQPVYNTVITRNDLRSSDPIKLIGEDAYAIPLDDVDLSGKLKFKIYPPLCMQTNWNNYVFLSPVVYLKNFSLKFAHVPENYTVTTIENYNPGDDIIYQNIIDSNNVEEFDDLELKINTYSEEIPLSLSYIMDENKCLDVSVYKNTKYQRQEKNLIEMYYDHYSNPKQIYECVVHREFHPADKVSVSALDTTKTFVVDSQVYDVKTNTNSLKIIEY